MKPLVELTPGQDAVLRTMARRPRRLLLAVFTGRNPRRIARLRGKIIREAARRGH